MAIPFYENEEQLQHQHQAAEEIDQVDGPPIMNTQNSAQNHHVNTNQWESPPLHPLPINHHDLMAWKILALAMCKALKDHYQQHISNASSTPAATTSGSSAESSTAVIQILPNGQVKPQWN